MTGTLRRTPAWPAVLVGEVDLTIAQRRED